MKVLGLMGSPRISGNTALLRQDYLKGAESLGATSEKILVDDWQCPMCGAVKNEFEKIQ